jgi:hypothetical protein
MEMEKLTYKILKIYALNTWLQRYDQARFLKPYLIYNFSINIKLPKWHLLQKL